jgi:hypothetical protein
MRSRIGRTKDITVSEEPHHNHISEGAVTTTRPHLEQYIYSTSKQKSFKDHGLVNLPAPQNLTRAEQHTDIPRRSSLKD